MRRIYKWVRCWCSVSRETQSWEWVLYRTNPVIEFVTVSNFQFLWKHTATSSHLFPMFNLPVRMLFTFIWPSARYSFFHYSYKQGKIALNESNIFGVCKKSHFNYRRVHPFKMKENVQKVDTRPIQKQTDQGTVLWIDFLFSKFLICHFSALTHSSVIDNYSKEKRNSLHIAALYGKMDVQGVEVKDLRSIEHSLIERRKV